MATAKHDWNLEPRLLTPEEVQVVYDKAEADLRDALRNVTDFLGIGFQDYPWWKEACDLARVLGVGPVLREPIDPIKEDDTKN